MLRNSFGSGSGTGISFLAGSGLNECGSETLQSGSGAEAHQLPVDELAHFSTLHSRHVPILTRIVERTEAGEFYPALLLALPLLESILRVSFVELNACPQRLLTGRGPEYFSYAPYRNVN